MTTTPSLLKGAVAALVVFVVGDFVWHNVLLVDFYSTRLDAINGMHVPLSFPPFILLFEVIGSLGTAYFVLNMSHSLGQAIFNGAVLGLMMVSAVNFVNHSLILKWDITITLVDTLWGIAMGGLSGAAVRMMVARK